MITNTHLKREVKDDYRCIVISDIHGHLDRFKELLDKVNYTSNDYLIILGDFVEKGDQVLDTIHYVRELDQNDKTYVLAGNCEWAMMALLEIPELANEVPKYLKRVSANGCIREVVNQYHLYDGHETILGAQKKIREELKEELKYLSTLPVSLKFNDFLFVHAGIERRKDYENSSLSSLLEMQQFYKHGHVLDEIVVVGHLPTSNYDDHYINNHILIDLDKKVICVDGGTGVKQISQLNALIIESTDGNISYKTKSVQPLKSAQVLKDEYYEDRVVSKIAFPYFEVEILENGEEFSYCRQLVTENKLYIKNEFLYERHNKTYCLDDYTDAFISLKKGDIVKVIGIYNKYTYVIYNNKVGWMKTDNLSIDF